VLLKTIATVTFCLFIFVQISIAAPQNDACSIPLDLQRDVDTKYPGATLVSLSDLDEDDRAFFQADHGDACPGLVRVDFYGDGKPTLALVLVKKSGSKKKSELVLAHLVEEHWQTMVLDIADEIPVVWSLPPGKYQDVYNEKTIRAPKPVIVLGRYESWAILYAWTGKRAIKIWIAD